MLSFKRGKQIAAVCGGTYDGEILRLTEEEDEPDIEVDQENFFTLFSAKEFCEHVGRDRTLTAKNQCAIRKAIIEGYEPADEYLLPVYEDIKEKLNERLKKQFDIDTGCMFILPSEETERVFIAGKSGSGKSFLAALYMNEYHRMFPKRTIYLISRHDGEKAYAEIPHQVIPLSEFENGESPVELKDLSESLVVFDDCDNVPTKKLFDTIKKLCDDIISNGRKYGIHTVWLNHQLMEATKTRNLLNEANKVIFFNAGSAYHNKRFLKEYAGFLPEVIKKISKLKSRWCMVSMAPPQYIVHEHGAFLP
jgi:hypothetical protein